MEKKKAWSRILEGIFIAVVAGVLVYVVCNGVPAIFGGNPQPTEIIQYTAKPVDTPQVTRTPVPTVQVTEAPTRPAEQAREYQQYNIRRGQTISVNNYCDVTLRDSAWGDRFGPSSGAFGIYSYTFNATGDEIYFVISVGIKNTMKSAHNFRNDYGDPILYYGDGYQFKGFVEEYSERTDTGVTMALGKGVSTEVDPLHEKKYYVAFSLPKSFENSTDPVYVSFTIGDNIFYYDVR